MRVLVTGAAGFIGSHLCEALCAQSFDVTAVDNFDAYYDLSKKRRNLEIIEAAGAQFVELDLRDGSATHALLSSTRPDVIAHLAAKAGVRNSILHPKQYMDTNLGATQNLFDAALAAEVPRIVFASTSSVYGDSETIPFREDDLGVNPLQPYATSKRAAEMLASTYHTNYGLQTTVLRFFTVYGPRGRPDMMPYLLADSIQYGTELTLFDGPMSRDWTFVSDICAGVTAAIDTSLGFEIINLGRGRPLALRDFIAELESVAGKSANLVPAERPPTEVLQTWADISKARRLLGFEPEVSVEVGIDRFWQWYSSSVG